VTEIARIFATKNKHNMNRSISLSIYLSAMLMLPAANATDLRVSDSKSKAATVCAACHGANGVSVADHIPNLAGQRGEYLSAQLKAFRDGSRKSDIMNAIAEQLGDADIENVIMYFSSQVGTNKNTKSPMLPNLLKTNVSFPANYRTGFTRYHTLNNPERLQVNHYYANSVALAAARAGQTLPEGSSIFVEIHAAKLDTEKKPLTGNDGFFVSDRVLAYSAMSREAGWGTDIPDMLRNENWNYALFTMDRQPRKDMNQAECLACHKSVKPSVGPVGKSSYVFTLKHLAVMPNER
jgi:cytochrome c553